MAPRPRFCVIADDLTGALDTAAPFASHGWRTRVVPWPSDRLGTRPVAAREVLGRRSGVARDALGDRPEPGLDGLARVVARAWAGADVVVVDTASRHVAPREAARRVRVAMAAGAAHGRGCASYKKIDSTLRGNVAAELAAFRRASGVHCLPTAPAFPAQGRTTRRGAVFVHGRALAASAAARDALDPVADGVVARLAPPGTLEVFDAETDADLRRIVRRLASEGRLRGLVGSGGLATAIAATLGTRRRTVETRASGPVLVVAGSAHAASRAQVAALVADGALGLVAPVASRGVARDVEATVLLAADALGAGRTVALVPPPVATGTRVDPRTAHAVAQRLAAIVMRLVAAAPVGAVFSVGGDTTAAMVAAAEWAPLDVAGALVPGVAVVALRPERRGHGPRWLVTKSGAFGDADTLCRLVRRLTL